MPTLVRATERSIFFANYTAFNIQDTKNYMSELKDRLGHSFVDVTYDEIMRKLTDLQFLVTEADHELMPDVHTDVLITMSFWFLRYGIRDRTFEYFNGDGDDDYTINTFDMTETDIEDDDLSTVDSIMEIILVNESVAGSEENPIELE